MAALLELACFQTKHLDINFMRTKLKEIGIIEFNSSYEIDNVIQYIFSCLLKNKNIDCNTLSIQSNIHERVINRLKYNSFDRKTKSNIEYIYKILTILNYSLSIFFTLVEEFISKKAIVVIFKQNKTLCLSTTEWEIYCSQLPCCKRVLLVRAKIAKSFSIQHRLFKEQTIELSMYPSSLILESKKLL